MYIITATFDSEAALERVGELLALSDSPERLAERLGIPRDIDLVKQAIVNAPFKRVLNDVIRLRHFVDLENQIANVKAGKSMLRFLGAGFQDKQLVKLEQELGKFGSLIEAPRWFYQQPRVQLLSAIRDFALDGSLQGDAAWTEMEEDKLKFPIAKMYEQADQPFAEALVVQLEKPLKDFDPKFLLEKFEGNRSISFDFDNNIAIYYTPAPTH